MPSSRTSDIFPRPAGSYTTLLPGGAAGIRPCLNHRRGLRPFCRDAMISPAFRRTDSKGRAAPHRTGPSWTEAPRRTISPHTIFSTIARGVDARIHRAGVRDLAASPGRGVRPGWAFSRVRFGRIGPHAMLLGGPTRPRPRPTSTTVGMPAICTPARPRPASRETGPPRRKRHSPGRAGRATARRDGGPGRLGRPGDIAVVFAWLAGRGAGHPGQWWPDLKGRLPCEIWPCSCTW